MAESLDPAKKGKAALFERTAEHMKGCPRPEAGIGFLGFSVARAAGAGQDLLGRY